MLFPAPSVCGAIIFSNANAFALTGGADFIHAHDPSVGEDGFNHVILLGVRRELLRNRLCLVERRRHWNTVEGELFGLDRPFHVHHFVCIDQLADAVSATANSLQIGRYALEVSRVINTITRVI